MRILVRALGAGSTKESVLILVHIIFPLGGEKYRFLRTRRVSHLIYKRPSRWDDEVVIVRARSVEGPLR